MKSVFFFKEDHQHNLTFLEGSQTELLVMRGSNFRQGNSVLEKKKKNKTSGNSGKNPSL